MKLQLNNKELLPSKRNAEALADEIVEQINEGLIDPLQLLARIEAFQLFGDLVRAKAHSAILSAIELHGKEAIISGVSFEQAEVGTKYDYSSDTTWVGLKVEEDAISTIRKDREKLLKALSKPLIETNPETGETIEIYPPAKTSTSSFKITLPK